MSLDHAGTQKTISAGRCVLRPMRHSDQGLVAHYASDLRVARMTSSIPHPYPPGAAEAFVRKAMARDRSEDVWVMDGSAEDAPELMGVIALRRLDGGRSEIGFWVGPPFWNTGLASDAVSALVAANPQGSSAIVASVFQDNPASGRVLVNCGFDYVGDAESFSVARGAAVPTWTYIRRMA